MLPEAAAALGILALAVPFGYLSRRVKRSGLEPVRKWSLFLGVVHAPVLPLVIFVKVTDVGVELELALVAAVLLGHLAGVLVHRQRYAAALPASSGAA